MTISRHLDLGLSKMCRFGRQLRRSAYLCSAGHNMRLVLHHLARLLRALLLLAADPGTDKTTFHPARIDLFRGLARPGRRKTTQHAPASLSDGPGTGTWSFASGGDPCCSAAVMAIGSLDLAWLRRLIGSRARSGSTMRGWATQIKRWARAVRRDAHALYLSSRDPRVPWYAKALAVAVAAYAFSPIDLIPDFVPVLGYVDDLIILPLAIILVVKLIPPDVMAEHRATAMAAEGRSAGRVAAAVVIGIWLLVAAWGVWVVFGVS